MLITVAICSRDRAEQLRRVLETAVAMTVPAGLDWEMIIIDNGSSDHTADVVRDFDDRLPIRLVSEPTAGLSNARNRAVVEARGDYICWTDDDVLIDRGWLAAYAQAFSRHPDAKFFGGPVDPTLEGTPPAWFAENRNVLGFLLAEREFGDQPIALSIENETLPFGANYAVNTAEQRRHRYDPLLGVAPQQRRLGEETKVIEAIAAAGAEGYWVPEARVKHLIPPARQTLAYVGTYQRSMGETWAYLSGLDCRNFMATSIAATNRSLDGVPVWIWRKMITHRLAYAITKLAGTSPRSLKHWQSYGFYKGAVDYLRRERTTGVSTRV